MKKNILYIVAVVLFFIPAVLKSQDINPTVEVTNSYVGKLAQANKPLNNMAVPDSLLQFNLNFDYAVFNNPYKGAYVFSPYVVDIKPLPSVDLNRKFYLKTGMGYALKPVFNLVWSPYISDKIKINLYTFHNSFMGRVRNIASMYHSNQYFLLSKSQAKKYSFPFAKIHKGWDSKTNVGINGNYDWKDGKFNFDLGYNGIHTKDSLLTSSYNSLQLKLGMNSNKISKSYFYYDALMNFQYGQEGLGYTGMSHQKLGTLDFDFKCTFGPKVGLGNYILVDVYTGVHIMNNLINYSYGNTYFTPKYVMDKNGWHISLGLKLASVFRDKESGKKFKMGNTKSQILYPDIRLGYEVIPGYMNFYMKLIGGDKVNTYSSFKENNHFYNPNFGEGYYPLIDNTVERINAIIGIDGNLERQLKYRVQAGYKFIHNGALDFVYGNYDLSRSFRAAYSYQDYNLYYVDMSFLWDFGALQADGFTRFNFTNIVSRKLLGFEPSLFCANLRLRYDIMNRIYLGVYGEYSSARRGYILTYHNNKQLNMLSKIPGFVNIGLNGEYKITRNFSLWGNLDNLFDQTIQRHPLYPDAGISFTLGICLNM